jgi:methionyl-tRNA formyltransferase
MGTPEFAVASLRKLVENNFNIVGVITSPDKPAGRGKKIRFSAVKQYAIESKLNIMQPANLKDPAFVSELKSLGADLQVVVAFRMLPEIVWAMPPKGTFNLHASLLPQYRGAAPINHAIINGETKTGLTTFFLDREIDTGKIIKQIEIDISEDDDVGSLHDRMMDIGGELIVETVSRIMDDTFRTIEQESILSATEELKPAPKIFKNDCRINWDDTCENVYNFVRGLSPYPAAHTTLENSNKDALNIKVFKTVKEIGVENLIPGSLLYNKDTLRIACNNGYLKIEELQLRGRKRMATVDFLRGIHLDGDYKATFV